jgi:hypothetical protein
MQAKGPTKGPTCVVVHVRVVCRLLPAQNPPREPGKQDSCQKYYSSQKETYNFQKETYKEI